jgi:thioredoxin 1
MTEGNSNEKGRVRDLDSKSFDDLLKEKKPLCVDFFATWCGPCQMLHPIIEEMAKEEDEKRFIVAQLDIDKAPKIAAKYQVMSVPTLIIFKNGKEANRMIGAMPKEMIIEKMELFIDK